MPILFTDENYLSTFGSVSKIWFSKAITDLDESLRLSGGRLIISKLSLVSSLEKIAEHFDIEKIVFNDLHEPYFVNYRKILREFCVINSLNIEFVNSSYLTNPGDVTNEKGDYYKVFTPFSKKFLNTINPVLEKNESLKIVLLMKSLILKFQLNS